MNVRSPSSLNKSRLGESGEALNDSKGALTKSPPASGAMDNRFIISLRFIRIGVYELFFVLTI
jgi:hypothetical protein